MDSLKKYISNTFLQTKPKNLGNTFTGSTTPKMTPVPSSNPSNTNTSVPKITPVQNNTNAWIKPPTPTPTLPPAGQDYAKSLSNTGTTPTTTPTGTPTPTTEPKKDTAYIEYMKSIFNPEQTKAAQASKENALSRVADVQARNEKAKLDAIAEQEKLRYEAGGLKSGTQDKMSLAGRKSTLESAYGALEENAAVASANLAKDTYDSYINAGKSIYEAEQAANKAKEGFSLSKDQTRYEYNPTTGQYEQVGAGMSSKTGTGNADVDAWVKGIQSGVYKPSDVPDELKNSVASAMSTTQKPQSEISKQVSSVIDELIANPALSRISGPTDQLLGGAFGDAALAKNKFNQLKSLLSLDNIKYLKGTGAISDAEQRLLANASSAIGRNLSDEDFKNELIKLKEGLATVADNQIAPDEEEFLKSQGYSQEQIDALKGSFNQVGNTTASNIPQRNKNPGNVKQGGLADKLAVGVDNQGHLIFPDEQTGFEAMKMDLQAKISGRSKYLPPNPTIAQLGKVYAEDPNWGTSVAKILKIPLNTPTNQIPINNLVQAIAKQEGYYA